MLIFISKKHYVSMRTRFISIRTRSSVGFLRKFGFDGKFPDYVSDCQLAQELLFIMQLLQ
jgi:hypothetical protein